MNILELELFDDSFEERTKCEAEMYTDLGRTAFNFGANSNAYTYLTYAEKLHSSPQTKALLGFLECSYSVILTLDGTQSLFLKNKQDEYIESTFLKNERHRLIENTKQLLKLIENGNSDQNEYKNLGKIDLDPIYLLNKNFKDEQLNLEQLEKILSHAQSLFSDDQLNPYLEKLREKKKKEIKANEYNFKSQNLNINNLEDADKCIDIAQKAINAGQYEKAKSLLSKAERLHHTTRGKELLQQVLNVKAHGSCSKETSGSGNDGLRKTAKQNNEAAIVKKPEKIRQTTEDPIAAIQRVNEARNNYDILGVTTESTESDIRRAFRRLSLVLHPDKNKASGASEAFKAVTQAAEHLIKLKKRK